MSDSISSRISREIFLSAFFPPGVATSILPKLASKMRDLRLPKGHALYEAGAAADHFYFVASGEVTLHLKDVDDPWKLGARSIAGILDVLSDRPRARTALVSEDAHLLELAAEDWFDVLEDDVDFARGAVYGACRGTHETILGLSPTGGFIEPPPHEASPDAPPLHLVQKMLVLRDAALFGRTSAQALEGFAECAEELRFAPGDTVFDRGRGANAFHVVAAGIVSIERENPRLRARFGPGSVVAGVATLTTQMDLYAARAETRAIVLRLDHDDFFDAMEEHFEVTRALVSSIALETERLRAIRARRQSAPPPPAATAAEEGT